MKGHFLPALLLAGLLAGCSAGGLPTTTTGVPVSVSTTPTTDPGDDCRRLAEDAARYLEHALAALDGVTADQLADPSTWPEELLALQAQGEELDRRVEDLGCDLGTIQQEVILRAAELQAASPLGQLLLDLLLGRRG